MQEKSIRSRPILFSAPMVRAILAGTKTQTRRIAKPVRHPDWGNLYSPGALVREHEPMHVIYRACPYGQPGDRLWVRETFAHIYRDNTRPDERRDDDVAYKADHQGLDEYAYGSWKPSIHMPSWASRITLEITGVLVERLQDISAKDAIAEGVRVHEDHHGKPSGSIYSPVQAYCDLWESINGHGSWDANPWVWVLEFKRVEGS